MSQLLNLPGLASQISVDDRVPMVDISTGIEGSVTVAELFQVSEATVIAWADRATVVAAGYPRAFFTDVGVGGSYWDYLGGRWRPQARSVVLKNLVNMVSNNAAPKTVMDYAILHPGLVQDGDVVEIDLIKERTGGTSDTESTDIMIGTAPTVLGSTTNLVTSGLATTNVVMATRYRFRRESATSVRPMSIAGSLGLGAFSSHAPATVPDMDAQTTYLQITSDLISAAGEVAWLRGFMVRLISGA